MRKVWKDVSQFSSAVKHCSIEKPVETGAVCPVCGKKLLLKRSLKRHMQTMHGPGKKVIQDAPQNNKLCSNVMNVNRNILPGTS